MSLANGRRAADVSVPGTTLPAIGLTLPQAKRANGMSRRGLKEIAPGRNTADTLCDAQRLYLQGNTRHVSINVRHSC
jgi:hypothetical protein